jgi:hypothetical protein
MSADGFWRASQNPRQAELAPVRSRLEQYLCFHRVQALVRPERSEQLGWERGKIDSAYKEFGEQRVAEPSPAMCPKSRPCRIFKLRRQAEVPRDHQKPGVCQAPHRADVIDQNALERASDAVVWRA